MSLRVTDGQGGESQLDNTIITVDVDQTPIADAGENLHATQNLSIDIDGRGSYDSQGLGLTYSWKVNAVPEGSQLSDVDAPDQAQTSFTPDVSGVYVLTLTVNNGLSDSAPDMLMVTAASSNPQAPVANPENTISNAEDCSLTQLSGSDSYDPNGDPLSYWWTIQSKPESSSVSNDSFSDRTAEEPTLFADASGEYLISLSVHDGQEWSAPEMLTVMATERSYNTPPVVDAGTEMTLQGGDAGCSQGGWPSYSYSCMACDPVTVNIGDLATISDADNDGFSYSWSVVEGNAQIDDPSSMMTDVTMSGMVPSGPSVCVDTLYRFALTATDCTGAETVDVLPITVSCCGVYN